MNKKSIIFVILYLAVLGYAEGRAQTNAMTDTLSETLSQAISRGDATVKISYMALSHIEAGDVTAARNQALQDAFQDLIKRSTEHLVPQDRLLEVETLVQNKIYQKARMFILSFQPLKSTVGDNEYRLPLEVTIDLKALQKALVDHKILFMNYSQKEVHLTHLHRFKDYLFIKESLEKELHGLRRMVEIYQKEEEVRLLIEATSTQDEIVASLNALKSKEGAPSFTVAISSMGFIEVAFLR